jgi:phosphoribosylanthranilate isomerase
VTRVKICGITGLADARQAGELGAWAIGMVFWPGSARVCSAAAAEEISIELKRQVELAGVFVNATLDEVVQMADRASLSLVQLHGDEGPLYCAEVARRTGARVIKAARVRHSADVRDLQPFHTDFHLLDAYSDVTPGGTGENFDWSLATLQHQLKPPLILSGGLTPDNVGRAIAQVHPYAVDVASGVEASPGRKDPAKVQAFFRAVALADERTATAA